MPLKRNPVALAAGKLILAIEKQHNAAGDPADDVALKKVLGRARTLLQAAHASSATNLLSGRSVAEYLGVEWVDAHPEIKPSIEAFTTALRANEGDAAGVP